jgi:hypothetical protein
MIKITLRNIIDSKLGYKAKERKESISNITWDKINRRGLLKAQICGGQDLSEQQKRLLTEEYRSFDKEVLGKIIEDMLMEWLNTHKMLLIKVT